MEIILLPRGAGKTQRLIDMAYAHGGYIVTSTHREAQRVHQVALSQNKNIPFPLTFNEFSEGRYYAEGVYKVYIDNVDEWIRYFAKCPVAGITMTATEDAQDAALTQLRTEHERLKELADKAITALENLRNAGDSFAADQTSCTDRRVGNVQPITAEEGEAFNLALVKADEALQEYEVAYPKEVHNDTR